MNVMYSVLRRLWCRLGGKHVVKRRAVHHDGDVYRGRCRYCGIAMLKDEKGWRTAKAARD